MVTAENLHYLQVKLATQSPHCTRPSRWWGLSRISLKGHRLSLPTGSSLFHIDGVPHADFKSGYKLCSDISCGLTVCQAPTRQVFSDIKPLIPTPGRGDHYHPHFTKEEIESQTGYAICQGGKSPLAPVSKSFFLKFLYLFGAAGS